MGIEQKIRALSLKTIENGASAAEAEAAKRMIHRLKSPSAREPSKVGTKYADGTYNNLPITEVDWDEVAKEQLGYFQYADYVNDTSVVWEQYNKTRLRVDTPTPMTLAEYRIACYKAFVKHHDTKQIT